MKKIALYLSVLLCQNTFANTLPTAVTNGVKDDRHAVIALTNAHIFLDENKDFKNATLLIQDNKIINVGKDILIPESAIQRDLHGASIYPGFIHLDSDYGLSKVPKRPAFTFFGKETIDSTLPGAVNSNEAVKASYNAIEEFHQDTKKAKALRKIGFSTALASKHDGIMRGTSVLVSLSDEADQKNIIESKQAFHYSFDKGSSKQMYPISLMGASALLRQTWLDAQWYGEGKDGYTDVDLQAINDASHLLQIFEAKNWQQTVLADKIAKEYNRDIVIRSSGDEYKHIDAIKKLNRSVIVPLDFPKAMDVSDALQAWDISLEKMMEWEAAPYNLYYLHSNAIDFAIAPSGNGQKSFLKNLQASVKKGLPKSAALAALTSTPARLLGQTELGHLHRGAQANFIVVEGDIFEKGSFISENWVAGQRYLIQKLSQVKPGKYSIELKDTSFEVNISSKSGKPTLKSTDKESKLKYSLKISNDFAQLEIKNKDENTRLLGIVTANGTDVKSIVIQNIAGQTPQWRMIRLGDVEKSKEEDKKPQKVEKAPQIPQPFSAYGMHKSTAAHSFLITNATVWTNEKEGVLKDTDVFINKGKIERIGKNLALKADSVIDGSNYHLTSGVIDEHSHIALLSVNDIATNSSMVRMEDSLDSDAVNIYRNLAGGVTAAQLLHGSANPLGGQSAIIKMRWGATGDELLVEGADKFIKFALGENVKRSASQQSIRYPLTRMGVEQVYRDAFANALAYEKQWQNYRKLSKNSKKKIPAPRRDLMLDATLEIINKERFISCHSYVQSEINMLMKVADDYDFNVNTFTHILEGYKVADKMKKHGVGASTFSDWWSYKWEVNYAIPYNASIMTKAGVTTAINSDDAEMSRRLNQEAAKSVKYGGLSEQEAWKLVTLNPAKLLHLDKQMGSIKIGKDADIVLWSDNPLSIYAKAEKTFVDGRLLYDRSQQAEIEKEIAQERARLIDKINSSDQEKMPAMKMPEKHMQCDSLTGYEYLLGAVQ